MAQAKIDRKALVIAVGGGVICDLAGFVASCYMRGLDTVFFPTSLLAMVDAAIGGKNAVNFSEAKNRIGTFHFPKQILVDPSCLLSLPQRQFSSGLAEVIKYGMIRSAALADRLKLELTKGAFVNNSAALEEIISWCIRIKEEIVQEDPFDRSGTRAFLNFGHTFGHAFETAFGLRKLLHGEAIALGMCCAVDLSLKLGLCPSSVVQLQEDLLRLAHLPTRLPACSSEKIVQIMQSDKKVISGKLTLILLKQIGDPLIASDVCPSLVEEVIRNRLIAS